MSESLRRQISSPAALFVFEATARHGSFRAAALELNVTQPSISYQIKGLEKHLGARLFERRGRIVYLTDDGERLYRSVKRGFADIQAGIAEISRSANEDLVALCSSSSAAAHLILPRYPNLRKALPSIDLNLKIMSRDVDPATESADFTIWLGDGQWPGLQAWRLFDEVYFPVCAPTLLDTSTRSISIDDLKLCNLLYLKERFRKRDDWQDFFEKAGSPLSQVHERLTFSDQEPLLEAAVSGQGLALGWFGYTDHFLSTGALIKPVDFFVRTNRAFYLMAPEGVRFTRTALKFRDWLIEEGKEIQQRLEAGEATGLRLR
jgi:DNA-binding transcriptional LysR family regulator